MNLRLLPLVLAAASLAAPAVAEEPEEDLDLVKLLNIEVSTATKTAESLDEAPAVITVVTREDIRRWGFQTVAEVLQYTVGFYLLDDHIIPNAAVRGMSGGLGAESGVLKVMIDGRSVAYRSTSGNWLGIELIPMGSIEQIEIIRGPASALYGSDAFLGVVNIITVRPERLRPLRVKSVGGLTEQNFGGHGEAVSGFRTGDFDFLFGAAYENADRSGLSLPEESPAPTLPSSVGERRIALGLQRQSLVLQSRIGYRPTNAGHLVLSAYGSALERGGDFAHWAQLTHDPDVDGSGTTVALGQLRLNVDAALPLSQDLSLAFGATHFRGGMLPKDKIEIGSDLLYVERNWSYEGFDANLEARFVPSERFNLIVGAEVVRDTEHLPGADRINRETGQVVGTIENEAPGNDVTLSNVGAFISSNYQLVERWLKLTGGLRIDRHSEYAEQLTGRVGLTTRWSDSVVSKLLYGTAFKAPSPYLLYAAPLRPGDVVGNPSLAPQYVHTVEAQGSLRAGRFVSVRSGVSHSWLEDKAEFTPQGINLTARNVARQRSFTWESRIDVKHYDDYSLYGSFELVESVRELGQEGYAAELVGSRNVVYPPWIARVGGVLGLPSHPDFPLELGSRANVVGPRRAADTTIVETGQDVEFAPYLMLDAWLATRELYLFDGQESTLALRGRNLLVARGPDPSFSGFEQPLAPAEIFLELVHVY